MSYRVQKKGEIIPLDIRQTISSRYHKITKAINKDFWDSCSDTEHSIYVGSYGRGTAVDTSDIDILVELPEDEYNRYDQLKGNGQSRLLQDIKNAILESYPKTDIRADGQVVKVQFSDGIKFEVLPAFRNISYWGNWDGTYRYPDSNMGGNWCSTNPKAEQKAMAEKNSSSNGLLYDTCKHMRYIRDNYFSSYKLSGIVIDSFVYAAIGNWKWSEGSGSKPADPGEYEKVLLDYYNSNTLWGTLRLSAPGSNDVVETEKSVECLKKVLDKMIS